MRSRAHESRGQDFRHRHELVAVSLQIVQQPGQSDAIGRVDVVKGDDCAGTDVLDDPLIDGVGGDVVGPTGGCERVDFDTAAYSTYPLTPAG